MRMNHSFKSLMDVTKLNGKKKRERIVKGKILWFGEKREKEERKKRRERERKEEKDEKE